MRDWFFVYGTLRPGEGNYWIEPAVLDVIEDCTTQGEMFAQWYPWVNFDGTTVITGTLLMMDSTHNLTQDMVQMEVGAGYTLRQVAITLPGSDQPTIMAKAFHYGRCERFPDHYRVPSGNFRDCPGSNYHQGTLIDDDEDEPDDEIDYDGELGRIVG